MTDDRIRTEIEKLASANNGLKEQYDQIEVRLKQLQEEANRLVQQRSQIAVDVAANQRAMLILQNIDGSKPEEAKAVVEQAKAPEPN